MVGMCMAKANMTLSPARAAAVRDALPDLDGSTLQAAGMLAG